MDKCGCSVGSGGIEWYLCGRKWEIKFLPSTWDGNDRSLAPELSACGSVTVRGICLK